MRLSKEEFVKYVDRYEEIVSEERNILDALDANPEWKPGGWVDSLYILISDLCDFTEEQYEDVFGTPLDYYCWELGFGHEADANIKNASELYDYIVDLENAERS